ncbi:hypothetical protein DPMN_122105 [Dreissena polymorpha]|uniref:Uncharacterized protein n=1 Tax=Dreissena polymorpha TaxID=45954 RepID=A0A9D4GND7_DREPO|nr:hypothetical protein DPMN_122105 [Dreissena polymorpha]
MSFQDHMITCASKRISFKVCEVAFKKTIYLKRHYARTGHDKITQDSDKACCAETASACVGAVGDKAEDGESREKGYL